MSCLENLMDTTLKNIKNMVDVNTIIGEPIKAGEVTIIPVSRVAFGFGSGGSSFGTAAKKGDENFGGGAGGGVSISPVAFMVVGKGQIRLMPVSPETNIYDRILDIVPGAIDKLVELKDNFVAKREAKRSVEISDSSDFSAE